jgi:hypothetical protein
LSDATGHLSKSLRVLIAVTNAANTIHASMK